MKRIVWLVFVVVFSFASPYMVLADPPAQGPNTTAQRDMPVNEGAWYTMPLSYTTDIDAALNWGNGKVYFFKADEYIRYDIANQQVDSGYPKKIEEYWPGLWTADISAVVNMGDGYAYFFKGDEYMQYDIAADEAVTGYPQPIAGNWHNVWSDGVDAALNLNNGNLLMFKGDEFLVYNTETGMVEEGFPASVAEITDGTWPTTWKQVSAGLTWDDTQAYLFNGPEVATYDIVTDVVEEPQLIAGDVQGSVPGIWADGIEAAVLWGEKVFLFKGNEFASYDVATGQADLGFPKPVTVAEDGYWPGLWPDGVDAALNGWNGEIYFFKGDEYLVYDIATDTALPNYPKKIRPDWPGLWPDGVDAALKYNDSYAYFFKGDAYMEYDVEADKISGPYDISDWDGVWATGPSAAVNMENGSLLMTAADEYLLYDVEADTINTGYPIRLTTIPLAEPEFVNRAPMLRQTTMLDWANKEYLYLEEDRYGNTLEYTLSLFELEGYLVAEISINGTQTGQHFLAVGDIVGQRVNFYFVDYYDDNVGGAYAEAEYLMALEQSDKLRTYWGALYPLISAAYADGEHYFEEVSDATTNSSTTSIGTVVTADPIFAEGQGYVPNLMIIDVDGNGIGDFGHDGDGLLVRGTTEFGKADYDSVTLDYCQGLAYYDEMPHDPNSSDTHCFQTDQGYYGKFSPIERDADGGVYIQVTIWDSTSEPVSTTSSTTTQSSSSPDTAPYPTEPMPYGVSLGSIRYERWGAPTNTNGCGGPYDDTNPRRNFRSDISLINYSDETIQAGWRPYLYSAKGHALPSCWWSEPERPVAPGQSAMIVWGTFVEEDDWVSDIYFYELGYPIRICMNQAGSQIPCQ